MSQNVFSSYSLDVHDQRSYGQGSEGKISSGVLVFVYEAGTKTLATLYKNQAGIALPNPITRAQFEADGGIKFFSSKTSVDIVLNHSDGSSGVYGGVTDTVHNLYLDRSGASKCIVIPFGASNNAEVDTGIDLPSFVHVHEVAVEVVTEDATETIDLGLLSSESGGNADGLIEGASVATAGFLKSSTVTTGSSETYVSATHYGVMMGPRTSGADDANADTGVARGFGHYTTESSAKSLTYTGSAGSDTAAGYFYVFFRHLR